MTPSATVHAAGDLPFALIQPSRSLPLKSTTAPSGGFLPRVASFGSAWAATTATAVHPRIRVVVKKKVRIGPLSLGSNHRSRSSPRAGPDGRAQRGEHTEQFILSPVQHKRQVESS